MIKDEMLIGIGKIFKPHGYKGEMNIDLDYDADIFQGGQITFIIKIDNIPVPFFVENIRGGINHSSFLKLKGIDSDIEASRFANKELYALKQQLLSSLDVDEDSFYLAENEMIGYSVVNEGSGENIGKITNFETGVEYDYMIVEDPIRESRFSIPFIDEFVKEIKDSSDHESGLVLVELPEGFLEIF